MAPTLKIEYSRGFLDYHYFVAKHNGDEIARITSQIFDKEKGYIIIRSLSVNVEYQNIGIGTKLMNKMMQFCIDNQITECELNANPTFNCPMNVKQLVHCYGT